MEYMTPRQRQIHGKLLSKYKSFKELTPADETHIESLACILDQIMILQTEININGSFYRSVTREGNELIKEHPAQRHLAQCRAQASTIAQKIVRNAEQQPPPDELEQFLSDNNIRTS